MSIFAAVKRKVCAAVFFPIFSTLQVRTIGRRKRTYLDEKCAGAITPKNPTLAVRVESDINQVQEGRGGLGEKVAH
jgi:hypothetical protein